MSDINPAKTTAANYLDEIESTLRIRTYFNEIIVSRQHLLYPALEHDTQGKYLLHEALSVTDTDESALNRGLIIQANSVFELFIRLLITAVTDHLSRAAPTFSKLEKTFRNQFFAHAGRVMNCIPSGTLGGQSFDFDPLLKSVGACISDDSSYQIDSSVFHVLMGNCTPDRVEKLFSILCLGKPFSDQIGKNPDLQRILNERSVRRVANLAREELGEQIKLRNDIAHGVLTETVSTADVEYSISFFRALIYALSDLVENKLSA